MHKNECISYLSHSLYPWHQRGRDLIFDGFRFPTCISSLHLLKILQFIALARYLIKRPRRLLQKVGGWTLRHLGAEHLQLGNRVQTIWKTIYINKPRKFGCTLLKVKPKVSHYILFWKKQQRLCIMISYAELDTERTSPFLLTRNLISGKKAIWWRKCYFLEWLHFCHHHLPPPPNIHTDWEQRKVSFLNFASPSKEEGKWRKHRLWNHTNVGSTNTGCETYKPWDLGQVIFSLLKCSHLKKKIKMETCYDLHHEVIVRSCMETCNEEILRRGRALPECYVSPLILEFMPSWSPSSDGSVFPPSSCCKIEWQYLCSAVLDSMEFELLFLCLYFVSLS